MSQPPTSSPAPGTLLRILVDELDTVAHVGLLGLCAGFEDGAWRADALASNLLEWVPDWVLNFSERATFSTATGVAALRNALGRVYESTQPENRGEIGELLLHIAVRHFFHSETAVNKLYFKDASNDTVKGFDSVHVVPVVRTSPGHIRSTLPETAGPVILPNADDFELELWLGESKFYSNVSEATSDVLIELTKHLGADYLRSEFAAITNKIDPLWPWAGRLKILLSDHVSLDEVFARAVIPILLTYDSAVLAQHSHDCDEYRVAVVSELRTALGTFVRRMGARKLPREVVIRLILMPLATKRTLLAAFDERLKAWQKAL